MSRKTKQPHPLHDAIRRIEGWRNPDPGDHQWLASGLPCSSMEFIRITGVPIGIDSNGCISGIGRWLHGMWAGGKAAGVLAVGSPAGIDVLLGSPSPARAWSSRLRAALPGCSIDFPGESILESTSEAVSLPWKAVITGHPGRSEVREFTSVLDELVVVADGCRWAWMVFATPLAPNSIHRYLNEVGEEIQETVSSYLRRDTAEEGNHPAAQRYLELLHAVRSRGEVGLSEGLWETRTMLATESRGLLEIASQSVQAQFGSGGLPEPVRVRAVATARSLPPQAESHCATLLATSELAFVMAPPQRETAGYQIRLGTDFDEDTPKLASTEECLALGSILSRGKATGNWVEVPIDSLASHLLIAGATGTGKTRTTQFIVRQLWEDHRIPSLIIEPSLKAEYRSLLASPFGADLRILTPGKESVAPMRLNPLEVPAGVLAQTHLDALLALFKAAFSWVTPMPYVLEQALHRVYDRSGWDLTGSSATRGTAPSLPDLADAVEEVAAECGWDAEITANIRAGLLARLRGLTLGAKGRIFNTTRPLDVGSLLTSPAIIELAGIGNDDEKAFLTGLIALRIVEHRQAEARLDGTLRHMLVIEEAHRLLRAGGVARAIDSADPGGHAVEAFAHMLAEVRAFGQGIAVVEQIPSKLLPDVVKNTAVKVIHRLAGEDDRELVGGSAGLSAERREALSILAKGEAIIALAESGGAYRVRIPDHTRAGHGGRPPTDPEVAQAMADRFPLSIEPVDPFDAVRPRCPLRPVHDCPGCGSESCRWQKTFLPILNRASFLKGFEPALDAGWESLLRFARREIGGRVHRSESNAAAIGLMAHLADLLGWAPESREKLLRNLQRAAERADDR